MNKKGFTLTELLVVIAIIGILAGALFPAISGAILSANMSAALQNGKKIHQAILAANLNADQRSRPHVWPSTTSSSSGTSEGSRPNIAKKAYSKSSEYFWDAMDGENITKAGQHFPTVPLEFSWLTASGISAYPGSGELQSENVAWTIAANVNDNSLPETIPVLMTRNFDASALVLKFDGSSTTRVDLGVGENAAVPFGTKGFVMVRLGGAGEKYDPGDATLDVIFSGQAFDASEVKHNGETLKYLTPYETVSPKTS